MLERISTISQHDGETQEAGKLKARTREAGKLKARTRWLMTGFLGSISWQQLSFASFFISPFD